jgi:multidrug resistance efflux pump
VPEQAAVGPSSKRWWWVGFAILLLYSVWIIAPYLQSVLSRDAAVTTWIHVASAPIDGRVDQSLLAIGTRVGADGIIMRVHNERADQTAVKQTAAEVARAESAVAQLRLTLDELMRLNERRGALIERYATALTGSLAIEIDGAQRELGFINQRLELIRATAGRKDALARKGNTARSEADEAQAEVAELELQRVEQEKAIAHARHRQAQAAQGVYLADDGSDPDWAFRSQDAVQLELARTRAMLADAEAVLGKARADAAAALEQFELTRDGVVEVPAGSVVWSLVVGAGASVEVGMPVAHWLDCDAVLVDVPVSDVELALLHPGMPADVLLEGEAQTRRATILMTRGAASTLGSTDLAAIAKGRQAGIGQVILNLDHTERDVDRCEVGQAAFVDFPDIGLIEIIRARLRL